MDPQPAFKENRELSPAHRAVWEWANALNSGIAMPDILPESDKELAALYDHIFRTACNKFADDFAHDNDLPLDKYADELSALRQNKNAEKTAQREREIIATIQESISTYGYSQTTNHPADILSGKQMNCVGATMLGGSILKKIGIDCACAETGSHVLLMVRTSDGKVFWQDMQDGLEEPELKNTELTPELVDGTDSTGSPVTPETISQFIKNPKSETFSFFVDKKLARHSSITLREFFSGIELNELINTGFALPEESKTEEALAILEIARQRDPQNADIYIGFGKAYRKIGKKDEAIKAFAKALELDPEYPFAKNAIKDLEIETERA